MPALGMLGGNKVPASKEYFRNYYLTRKRKLFVLVGGADYHCVECDYRGDDLEFDHIDPGTKLFSIGSRIMQGWKEEKYQELLAELEKCQLLCPDHHLEKTRKQLSEERGWRHGTWYGWMTKKCPCPECSVLRDAYNAQRRQCRSNIRGPYGLPAEHGTYKRYKRGCKCDPCKRANADRSKDMRASK